MSRAVTRPFDVFAQTQSHFIAIVQLEHHTFEVQQNVDDVFLYSVDRGVLVQNARDSHFGDGVAHHGRKQYAPNGVAQGMTVAPLERFERDLGSVVAELLDVDGLGLQQICLHADFLSIPPARYTGKAGEAPARRCLAGQGR
jgi:hypothetical protein